MKLDTVSMNLYLKHNIDKTCRVILQEQLDKFGFEYKLIDRGNVYFPKPIPISQYIKLHDALYRYGIEIIDNKKVILVQKVKLLISAMLTNDDLPVMKISAFLSTELQENFRTISHIFTEVCYISIENFIIIHKIELVKQLLMIDHLSLTEISFKLHYSSVAHLSNQFKKVTGLTPSIFQKLAHRKRKHQAAAIN